MQKKLSEDEIVDIIVNGEWDEDDNLVEKTDDEILSLADQLSKEGLLEVLHQYNWDEGFVVPKAISKSKNCDLEVALYLFDLAEGMYCLENLDARR